jgi:hypothetical protein
MESKTMTFLEALAVTESLADTALTYQIQGNWEVYQDCFNSAPVQSHFVKTLIQLQTQVGYIYEGIGE